jgi:dipeptidyl aminopeptidase/acylaminoacyl peptidase
MQQKPAAFRRIRKRIFRSEGLGAIDGLSMSIHIVDVRHGTIREVDVGRSATVQPAFSPCGRYLLFLGSDSAVGLVADVGQKLFTVDLTNGYVWEVLGDRWWIWSVAWSPCGERMVVAGDYDTRVTVPTVGLWVVDRDGKNAQCRTEGFIGNVGLRMHHDMPTWDSSESNMFTVGDATQAFATVMVSGRAELWRIALEGPNSYGPVVTGARACLIMDARTATSQLLYCVSDLLSPWELCLSDLAGKQERRLTQLNDAVLASWPAFKVKHLNFVAPDGLPLEGWHMRRADRDAPQPTVMYIHGGPFIATGHIFRFDLHLLAANGYAVLFCNFRGSAGYGDSFAHAIVGDWGGRGFPDHMAAVDCAIARGLADASRLGVWGASHGGFATCWVVSHTTRFRAAVAESAFTNFQTMYYLCDAPDFIVHDLGGRPDEIPDVYRARSPLTYASRCQTPTLMVHGEEDARCPIAEAEQFYRALHDAGCTTELVRIAAMNHMGDSTGPLSARRAQNEALLEWFERYL